MEEAGKLVVLCPVCHCGRHYGLHCGLEGVKLQLRCGSTQSLERDNEPQDSRNGFSGVISGAYSHRGTLSLPLLV